MLKLIGYWKDPDWYETTSIWPDPKLFVGEWPGQDQDKVLDYLDKGHKAVQYKGWSDCRLCCRPNGAAENTDGVWAWPNGLSHYVSKHNVLLPEEFLNDIRQNAYSIPELATYDYRPRDLNLDFWKEHVTRFAPKEKVQVSECV